jgi:hypothetical protein
VAAVVHGAGVHRVERGAVDLEVGAAACGEADPPVGCGLVDGTYDPSEGRVTPARGYLGELRTPTAEDGVLAVEAQLAHGEAGAHVDLRVIE